MSDLRHQAFAREESSAHHRDDNRPGFIEERPLILIVKVAREKP